MRYSRAMHVLQFRVGLVSPLLTVLALLACGSAEPELDATMSMAPNDPNSNAFTDWDQLPPEVEVDPELAPLGARLQTYQRVCARGRGDSFAQVLCAPGHPPTISSIGDLLALLGLDNEDTRAFALTGNSTSLVSRSVSAINPRLIVFPRVGSELEQPATMTAVGFVRGEQFAEIVSRDLVTADLNFYLLKFEQNCNYDAAGCDLASLLTEELEHNWKAYSVYDQDDLEATSFDCLSCHQPGGYGTKRILRMQELESPWLHWFPQRFGQRTESDRILLAQFAEAHGYESQYGGIPIATITSALDEGSGAQLEALLRAEGFAEQPNRFDAHIAAEVKHGTTTTWDARFEAHLRGEAIAVPYPRADVTDPAKRAAAVLSYTAVVQGLAPRHDLTDIRDVFSDDATHKLSFAPSPAFDARTTLLQMCGRCHDGRGNPALTKNQFNVLNLDQMSREMKDRAIARVTMTGPLRMPPWRVGALPKASIDAVVEELQK